MVYLPSNNLQFYSDITVDEVRNYINGDLRDHAIGEVGYSGTPIYNGFLDTDEWVGDLKGVNLYKTIDEMRTDAIISAIERGQCLPIEQGEMSWHYDDDEVGKDPFYENILNFCQKDFGPINKQQFLHNASLAWPYGFSVHEKCFYIGEDGLFHLEKLSSRLPKTLWKWRVDSHGNLDHIVQLVYVYGPEGKGEGWHFVPIPVDKILLITNWKEGGNFTGRSEYRTFYREWKIKDTALKQSVIAVQRIGGGIPTAQIDTKDDGFKQDSEGNKGTLTQVKEILKNVKAGESSWMVALGTKFDLLKLDSGALKAMSDMCQYCDESMYKSAFQMVMSLGTSATGSRALGSTFESLFYVGLEGKAQTICSAWDEQVTKCLIDLNFNNVEYYPKMTIKLKKDIAVVCQVLGEMKRFGLIEGNKELENKILNYYGMPPTTDKNRLPSLQQMKGGGSAEVQPIQGVDKLQLADIKPRRNPKRHEHVDFDKIGEDITKLKNSLAMELRHIVEPAMIDMGKSLVNGQKIYQAKVNYGNRVSDLFKKYYQRLLMLASQHVRKELSVKNEKIKMADPKTQPQNADDYNKWVDDQANLESYMLENEASSDVAQYYASAKARGLADDAMLTYIIDSLQSEKGQRYMESASEITGGYAMVREVSEKEFKAEVTSKTRTEIFDNHICDVCSDMDGMTYTKADDGEYYDEDGQPAPEAPFQDCIGAQYGNPCRGFYIYD